MDTKYDKNLLVTRDFREQAAILRHYEKQRVATANRLYALTEFPTKKSWGMHLPEDNEDVMYFHEQLASITDAENAKIEQLTGLYVLSPLHEWSKQFKGLAPGKLVARFLGEVGDPYLQVSGHDVEGNIITDPRVRKLSQLTTYVGMRIEDGRMPTKARGVQSGFKTSARTRLWLITDQLVKQHDAVYYPVFADALEHYAAEEHRGVRVNGEPRSDAQFEVLQRKWSRIKVQQAFLDDLYDEAKRLHEQDAATRT